ncbi:MAG: c-type cytochrome [Proteobacteria bacterium]|nr:c-type cytochrome [Pseudomonadota bacterium]
MSLLCCFFRIFILSVAFVFTPFAAWSLPVDCPPLPILSWSDNNTHESIVREVMDKHYGDWSSYISKWEQRLDRMKDTHERGKKTSIKIGSANILVKDMPAYIIKLEKRIAIFQCIKGENGIATASGKVVIPSKGDPELGEAMSKIAGCFGCHGVQGVSFNTGVPNLAGQNDLYLIKQMKEFQISHGSAGFSGVLGRHNKVMDMKVTKLRDEDTWNLAAFYSELSCAPGGQRDGVNVPTPKKTVLCEECHGSTGYSVYREIPNLAGQNESYLFKQLKALRRSSMGPSRSTDSDQRHHLFMSRQVASLTNADISALAKFYSGLNCR